MASNILSWFFRDSDSDDTGSNEDSGKLYIGLVGNNSITFESEHISGPFCFSIL